MRDIPFIIPVTLTMAAVEGIAVGTKKIPTITDLSTERRMARAYVIIWLACLAWHFVYSWFLRQVVRQESAKLPSSVRIR